MYLIVCSIRFIPSTTAKATTLLHWDFFPTWHGFIISNNTVMLFIFTFSSKYICAFLYAVVKHRTSCLPSKCYEIHFRILKRIYLRELFVPRSVERMAVQDGTLRSMPLRKQNLPMTDYLSWDLKVGSCLSWCCGQMNAYPCPLTAMNTMTAQPGFQIFP